MMQQSQKERAARASSGALAARAPARGRGVPQAPRPSPLAPPRPRVGGRQMLPGSAVAPVRMLQLSKSWRILPTKERLAKCRRGEGPWVAKPARINGATVLNVVPTATTLMAVHAPRWRAAAGPRPPPAFWRPPGVGPLPAYFPGRRACKGYPPPSRRPDLSRAGAGAAPVRLRAVVQACARTACRQ